MSKYKKLNRVLFVLSAVLITGIQTVEANSPTIWYDAPVPETDWDDWGMPIGNGRLGALFYGNVGDELIQFNEDSLWTGNSQWKPNPEHEFGTYEPFGDILISLDNHDTYTDYKRELDLSSGVATVSYTISGVEYTREYFSSFPDQVMVIRLTASAGSRYSGSVKLDDKHFAAYSNSSDTITAAGLLSEDYYFIDRRDLGENGDDAGNTFTFDGNNLKYESQMRVILDGGTLTKGEANEFLIDGANSVTILLAADTGYLADASKNFRGPDPHAAVTTQINKAAAKGFDALRSDHEDDFGSLFGRLHLDLGQSSSSKNALPTDRRIEDYRNDPSDPELEALMAQFGRYMMISSSREGSLPANLQGIWAPNYNAPWHSDYHLNVNLQMNYWLTGPGNLSECDQALTDWALALQPNLQEQTYANWDGRPGVSCGRTLNIFGGSGSDVNKKADYGWMLWLIWEHYAFTLDQDYLENVALPLIGENVLFWSNGPDLQEVEPCVLWAMSAQSPESKTGDGVSFAQEVVWELYTEFIDICDILGLSSYTSLSGTETVQLSKVVDQRNRLDWPAVGTAGQLEEFQDEDGKKAMANTHRHISHIAGLFPGRQITPRSTPLLADASAVSLDYRTDGGTSWSKAMKASARARLYDGDRAHGLLQKILTSHVYPSMLTAINKYDKFQIDCNFGFPAAVFEMLLQSHEGELDLLPALPSAWPSGSVSGISGRGGFDLDLTWTDGQLYRAIIHSKQGKPCRVRYAGKVVDLTIPQGSSVQLNGNLELIDASEEMAPTVGFSSPATDVVDQPVSAGSTLMIIASAFDQNGDDTIQQVTLYAGTKVVGSIRKAPYEWLISDLPEGSDTYKLIATDNTGKQSAAVTRIVSMKEFPPTVSFALPEGDIEDLPFGTPVTFTADAHDINGDETITEVSLAQDNTLIGGDSSTPFTWDVSNLEAGTAYTFRLMATDHTGKKSELASRSVSIAPQGYMRLYPSDDAYVRGGKDKVNKKHGTQKTLFIKDHPDHLERQVYLRFNLESVPSEIVSATLRLKVLSGEGSDTHTAYFVEDDDWNENSITYGTKPDTSNELSASRIPAVGDWLELDVTQQVLNEKAGNDVISVMIRSNRGAAINYHSREADLEGNRPQLIIRTGGNSNYQP